MNARVEKVLLQVLDAAICVFFTIMAGFFALGAAIAAFSNDGIISFIGVIGCVAAAYTCWKMRR